MRFLQEDERDIKTSVKTKNQKNKKIRDKTQTLRGVYRKTCIVCNKDVFQDVNP